MQALIDDLDAHRAGPEPANPYTSAAVSVAAGRRDGAALSAFIGRDAELARLGSLVADYRLVTVVGSAGIGKTRLAREHLARAHNRLAWAHIAELAPISAREDLGAAVAGQLGFASLDALIVGLADRPALLVLDNCEHLRRGASRLCQALATCCPSLHILATSREPLAADGEHLLILGPLGMPAAADDPDCVAAAPAVRLFVDRLRATGAHWEGDAGQIETVAELCRQLDGVPLAIELAAARSRALTPGEVLDRLDRRFELLRRADRAAGGRHGSLRAAIEASYELLEPDERAFFRALGPFAGPFHGQLAHAVAGRPGRDSLDTLDLLSSLVDRSLVVAEADGQATRYRLLESLRHYAAEAARAEGEWHALGDRFVDAMVDAADGIVREGGVRWSAALIATLLAQFRNLSAAIEVCIDRDATGFRAFRLAVPLWGTIHNGRAAEVAALCDRMLARWPTGDEPGRPLAEAVAASAYLVDGRIDTACALGTAIVGQAEAPVLARVLAWRALGVAARHRGDLELAAEHVARAAAAAAGAGLAPFARELDGFAASLTPPSELDRALDALERNAAAALADGDRIGEVWARLVAAHLLIGVDQRARAATALTQAEAALNTFDYPYGRNVAARLGAAVETLEHGWPSTRDRWRTAIDRFAAAHDLGELATTLAAAATLALRAGDRATADILLAAVPRGAAVGSLGSPFDRQALHDRLPPVRAAPHPGELLRRVREALAAPAQAEASPIIDARPPSASAEDGSASRAQSGGAPPARDAAIPAPGAATMVRLGEAWAIGFAGRTIQVRHLKGLDDLAVLFSRPEQEVHCIELVGGTEAGGTGLAGLDGRARQQYRARIRELEEAIDEARARNDPVPAECAEAELEALLRELSASFGRGGRERARGSAAERARTAVAWRIRAAIQHIGRVHATLGRHLANAVRTGTWCAYRPEAPVRWQLGRAS